MKEKIRKFIEDNETAIAYVSGAMISTIVSSLVAVMVIKRHQIVRIEQLHDIESNFVGYVATSRNGKQFPYCRPIP